MTTGGAASLALAADFRAALLAEGTVLFLVFVLLAIGWVACRELLLARARAWLKAQQHRWPAEPAWRRVLRIGFGVLWIVDGLLQAQPGMPAGLPSHVIAPAADGSPGWVVHVVSWSARTWSGDPVQAAAGAVWIQLGIGIWLASVSSPRWSRLAGLASAAWALVVWVFGEAFGGVLAPTASWLTGAPGAALFYCVAGGLLALPASRWRDPLLGRRILQSTGALLVAGAVVQAWPGRGFWQGMLVGPANSRSPGPLPSAIMSMASARQPAAVHGLVSWFAGVVAGHGFAVNLVAVVMLAAAGAGLLTGRPAIARPAAGAAVGLCLADWVLVQDLGVFGGLGTDPNSMLPQALILTAGLLAATTSPLLAARAAPGPAADAAATTGGATAGAATAGAATTGAAAPAEQPSPSAPVPPGPTSITLALLRPGRAARRLSLAFGTASASAVLTVWAVTMVLMGAAPMALAAVHAAASPAASGQVGRAGANPPLAVASGQVGRAGANALLAGASGQVGRAGANLPLAAASEPPAGAAANRPIPPRALLTADSQRRWTARGPAAALPVNHGEPVESMTMCVAQAA